MDMVWGTWVRDNVRFDLMFHSLNTKLFGTARQLLPNEEQHSIARQNVAELDPTLGKYIRA